MKENKILFVVDELEFKWFEDNKLVTNFWFIKEFLKLGINVEVTTKSMLFVQNAKGHAVCHTSKLRADGEIFYEKNRQIAQIESFDAVFFRPDPPVDVDYINACNVFDFVDSTKVKLVNNPRSIRDFNEKMHVNVFPQFAPENIVTNSKELIIDFVNRVQKAVIKPLNRCFGSGVFILNQGDSNLSSIISAVTENGKTFVMVQKYLDGAVLGDKRVLLINGEVMDECVRKLPAPNDFKFAEHSDKYFEKAVLTSGEKSVAQAIALKLKDMGLPLVGLDMIDEKVIEINVTSPCYFIKEINALYDTRFENKIMPKILDMLQLKETAQIHCKSAKNSLQSL